MKALHLKARLLLKALGSAKAWERALYNNDEQLAQQLHELNASSKDACGAWHTMSINIETNLNVLRLALQSGMPVDPTAHKDWEDLLHCAAGIGRTDVVKLLVEFGADVNGRNAEDVTPLYKALYAFANVSAVPDESVNCNDIDEHKKVVLYLLSCGADPNALLGKHKVSLLPEITSLDLLKEFVKFGASLTWDAWAYVEMDTGTNTSLGETQVIVGQHHFLFTLKDIPVDQWSDYLAYLNPQGQDHTTTDNQGNNLLLHCVSSRCRPNDKTEVTSTTIENMLSLLQNNGYQLTHTNNNGNNVWHVLFEKPHNHSHFWFEALKNTSAIDLLHTPNHFGKTPMDVLNASRPTKHQNILEYKAFIEKDLLCKNIDVSKASKMKRKL